MNLLVMRLRETEIIMQIIQWRFWNDALVKTRFLKIEATKEIPLLPCHYTSYKQKGSYLFGFFSIQKAVILKLVNIKMSFMLDFISLSNGKHTLHMRIWSKTCWFFFLFAFFP